MTVVQANQISYLDNPEATQAAFDEEGYFRTGDSARLVGPNVVLDGRFKTDCKSQSIPRCLIPGSI